VSSPKNLASLFGARGTCPAGSVLGDIVTWGAAPKGGTLVLANVRRRSVAEPCLFAAKPMHTLAKRDLFLAVKTLGKSNSRRATWLELKQGKE